MHQEHSHNSTAGKSIKNLRIAFFLNALFTIIEIIGGFLTNSVAIVADAIHDLGDTLGIGFAWWMQKISSKSRDQRFSYGYRRFSIISAVVNAIVLLAGSIFIIYETVPRLIDPQSVDARGMMFLAMLGVVFNGMAIIRLRTGKSINEEIVKLHLWEDVLGWVGVLIGSVIMQIYDLPIIDPILSALIALYILWNVFKHLRKVIHILLLAVPKNIDLDLIKSRLESLQNVLEVHDMHLWSLDGQYNVMTLHLVVPDLSSDHVIIDTKINARKIIQSFEVEHPTIEVEYESEKCILEDC